MLLKLQFQAVRSRATLVAYATGKSQRFRSARLIITTPGLYIDRLRTVRHTVGNPRRFNRGEIRRLPMAKLVARRT